LARRSERYLGLVDEIVNTIRGDAGRAIRIHGDYHLGQVLRTARDDFMIIDFEGEPARPLAERREKASPLRDVAGMLRSFAYAAATLGMEEKSLDVGTREVRIGRWERDVREAFLRGYLRNDGKSKILPSDTEHTRSLLRLFETEKAFYELAYELNNRPQWTWIPMRGIAKLL
jgi:maltose alpha-D-glucosyltransferase/alpha-amylase